MHGCEIEQGVCVHAALVQCGACPGQPDVLRRPPQCVVRPILWILCEMDKGEIRYYYGVNFLFGWFCLLYYLLFIHSIVYSLNTFSGHWPEAAAAVVTIPKLPIAIIN